jgi:hypothetical protein
MVPPCLTQHGKTLIFGQLELPVAFRVKAGKKCWKIVVLPMFKSVRR